MRKNLREIVVLGDLTKISFLAFEYSGIESFEVYGNVERIAPMACSCSKLKKFICHGNVKHIGELAFYDAWRMKELVLGDDIQSIGKKAFRKCNPKILRTRQKRKLIMKMMK